MLVPPGVGVVVDPVTVGVTGVAAVVGVVVAAPAVGVNPLELVAEGLVVAVVVAEVAALEVAVAVGCAGVAEPVPPGTASSLRVSCGKTTRCSSADFEGAE